jgi:transcription elongation factor Elf1
VSGQRQAPFYCPYCGEEDLVPADVPDDGAAWTCRSCLRIFALRHVGIARLTSDATQEADR